MELKETVTMMNSADYKERFSLTTLQIWSIIKLLSCSTGKKDKYGNCVAQELADKLGVRVYAPNDVLNIHPDGKLSVGKRMLSEEFGFEWFYPRKGGEKT